MAKEPSRRFLTIVGFVPVEQGDLNGDGRSDSVWASIQPAWDPDPETSYYGVLTVGVSNGDGTFTSHNYEFGQWSLFYVGDSVGDPVIGDFNEDGRQDVAIPYTGRFAGWGVGVFLGNGNGTLQPFIYAASSPYYSGGSLVTADFNGDGKLDMAAAGGAVLLGIGNGYFQTAPNAGVAGQAAAVGDFNRDGMIDLAMTSGAGLRMALGNGDGTFRPTLTTAATSSASAAVGDFDGDGFPDVALANGSSVSVLLNTRDWRSFRVSGLPATTTAGQANTITVTALDSLGNAMTGYTGAVHFTSSDGVRALNRKVEKSALAGPLAG